jgi:hypothetical protein
MKEQYPKCQLSMPVVLNGLMQFFNILQYTSDVIVVPCTNSTISTPFLFKKTVAVTFLQADNICVNFLSLFVNVCASTALTSVWFQHSQMKSRFHHLLLVQCDSEIHHHLCGITLKKPKPKPFSAFCAHL